MVAAVSETCAASPWIKKLFVEGMHNVKEKQKEPDALFLPRPLHKKIRKSVSQKGDSPEFDVFLIYFMSAEGMVYIKVSGSLLRPMCLRFTALTQLSLRALKLISGGMLGAAVTKTTGIWSP